MARTMGLNERKTENIVRAIIRELGYYDDNSIIVEEQSSDNPKIYKMLKSASKKGAGAGYPEFIITSNKYKDLLIVVECKADIRQHASNNLNDYPNFAVDGALLYGAYLSKEYDVISIGISGISKDKLKISQYLYLKGNHKYKDFVSDELLSLEEYYTKCIQHPDKISEDLNSLLEYSRTLNEDLHSHKIKESQRSLLISGILIALKNNAFKNGYTGHTTAKQLAENIVNTIANELSNSNIPTTKINNLKNAFSFIKTHSTLSTDKLYLETLITGIDEKINHFIKTHKYYDVLGQFYIEFLSYANNDKGLGIVLTPPHITELFARLAEVNKNSIVIDNTCGTAGFLISSMKRMIEDAKGTDKKVEDIQKGQIYGIEFQDDIYALAITNTIIHGDGKSNIHLGNCFELVESLKIEPKPKIGFLNPPYKTETKDKEELEFILNNLQFLETGGICIAIVPLSCALAKSGSRYELKKELMEKHTLEAVMSVPESLFHNSNVNTVTCIMVFKAHIPHNTSNKKTWFGYWRDDGFVIKKKGRVDFNNTWDQIQEKWVSAYINKETIPKFSLMQKVSAKDEWCAEAYFITDYSELNEMEFKDYFKQYLTYKILNEVEEQNEKVE